MRAKRERNGTGTEQNYDRTEPCITKLLDIGISWPQMADSSMMARSKSTEYSQKRNENQTTIYHEYLVYDIVYCGATQSTY